MVIAGLKCSMLMELLVGSRNEIRYDSIRSAEELFSTLLKIGFKKVLVIQNGLQPVKIPDDIPHFVQTAGDGYVNLVCEK